MTKQDLLKIAKPILFNGEMVRALLDGRKTVTRRVVKNASPEWEFEDLCDCAVQTIIDRNGNEKAKDVDGLWATFNAFDEYIEFPMIKSRYNVGDVLYVRETWAKSYRENYYRADAQLNCNGSECVSGGCDIAVYCERTGGFMKWRPSIHMPKEAARIFLRVKSVRVERLRDIDVSNCVREGVTWENYPVAWTADAKPAFIKLWDSTIKPADLPLYGWEANPWVWVYEFERVKVDE